MTSKIRNLRCRSIIGLVGTLASHFQIRSDGPVKCLRFAYCFNSGYTVILIVCDQNNSSFILLLSCNRQQI